MGSWIILRRGRIILVAVGLALLLVSLALLAYALAPGSPPLRLQSTLAPLLLVTPGGLP